MAAAAEKKQMDTAPHTPFYDPEEALPFFKRHFHRPITNDPDQYHKSEHRRFSLLSRGSLLCAGVVCLVLVTILCAVVALTIDHRHKVEDTKHHPSPIHEAIMENFPDPAILLHDGTWYAFGTNNAAGILQQPDNQTARDYGVSNVQIATSPDFRNWTVLNSSHDPLPHVGDWAVQDFTKTVPHIPAANVWAPAILKRPSDGNFVLYYSAGAKNATRSHCMGAALSNTGSPAGPYTPLNDSIACPTALGGAIDPAPFVDQDGTIYVAWKVDGNNRGHGGVCGNTKQPQVDTPIMLQKMKSDGFTRDGDAIAILHRTDADGPLVEAPAFARSHEGIYFMFFSSGCTRTPSYDLKYATSKNITGPWVRAKDPLLNTGDWSLEAPGSVGIGQAANGSFQMAFHARVPTDVGGVRAMFTSRIQFDGTVVRMIP